jgi:hypothetical protein
MFDARFHLALSVLEPLAPSGAGGAARLPDVLAALRVVRGGLDALEAGLLASVERNAAIDAMSAGGASARQARRIAARAETLAAAPELSAGLADGAVTVEQVDAVVRVAGGLNPEARLALLASGADLVAHGRRSSPEEFAREVRRLGDLLAGDDGVGRFEQQRRATRLRRGVDADSGMHWLHGEFDPITGGRVFTAIEGVLERWFHHPDMLAATAVVAELADDQEHLAAHALAQLCSRSAAGTARPVHPWSISPCWSTSTRCATGCTTTRPVSSPTAPPSRPPPSDGWRATRTSSRS